LLSQAEHLFCELTRPLILGLHKVQHR
jgi:hypothetical protein